MGPPDPPGKPPCQPQGLPPRNPGELAPSNPGLGTPVNPMPYNPMPFDGMQRAPLARSATHSSNIESPSLPSYPHCIHPMRSPSSPLHPHATHPSCIGVDPSCILLRVGCVGSVGLRLTGADVTRSSAMPPASPPPLAHPSRSLPPHLGWSAKPPSPPLGLDPRGPPGGPPEGSPGDPPGPLPDPPGDPPPGAPCGAKPRGGRGAPPTNLILARNQC